MIQFRFPMAAAAIVILSASSFAQPPVAFNDAGIHAIQFIDPSEGWAVGDDGVIWHSIDGGKTWERQKSGTRASLRGVHFQTPYTGWAVGRVETTTGSVGVMLHTTDGGLHWLEMGTNVLPGLHAVRFFNEKSGFVCGDGSPAFPSGLFTTDDGGRSWKPASGVKLVSCRSADFFPGKKRGVVGGAWGRLGTVSDDGLYQESDLDPLAGRTVHGVCTTGTTEPGVPAAFAAADGGAVLSSSDGGKSWGFVNLGLPPEALAACDFRCCAAFGSHVWVAGKPGGIVLHSADHGKTWEIQKTELSMPINGLYFLTHEIGWMVGELGCILGTTDGGKTWKVQRTGGQRAAVLCLHAAHSRVPLDVISSVGQGEGYLCAGVALTSADPATSNPARAADAARLRQAMRLAGGAAGDVGWAFPLAAHASGLPPRELMASWDRAHEGKAAEQLLRQAVLAIRIWQPEVIVADSLDDGDHPGAALALHAAKEAFKQAADPSCFPEQIARLGLKPWSAKKLYALSRGGKSEPVKLDQTSFQTVLADSPRDYAEPALLILDPNAPRMDTRAFALIAHRLEGAEKHASLMEGIVLARGGSARRPDPTAPLDPAAVEERKQASQTRRRLEGMAASSDPEFAGVEKILGILGTQAAALPDDVAARTVHTIASGLVRDGRWAEAREAFGLLAARYPGHPLALEGYRWLLRYHSSSEARRRAEIQQKLVIQEVTFDALPGAEKVVATGGTESRATRPSVLEERFRYSSPEAALKWHQSCLDLEPKLIAFGPVHSRDPSAWLCLLAARRQVGRHNDAIAFIRDYFKNTPAAAALLAGVDAWRDCLAAELWAIDRNLFPAPPKPACESLHTDSRPLLDGKLDDACWQNAKPIALERPAAPQGGDGKAFAAAFPSEVRFAYDGKFIYIAVSCSHPAGLRAEPVARRIRDADMRSSDRVDILLDLDRDYQTYYRFQVDHRGCLAEDCWGDRGWNPKYFAAFLSSETQWTAELAIPIAELTGEAPSHGRTWAMNATRIVPGKGLLSWSAPADQSPRPEGMGLLQFRAGK
jgi:photosystem II stability/assembly factor-like uncharacterized protein